MQLLARTLVCALGVGLALSACSRPAPLAAGALDQQAAPSLASAPILAPPSKKPDPEWLSGLTLPVSSTALSTHSAPVAVVSTQGLSMPGHPELQIGFRGHDWYGSVFAELAPPNERLFFLEPVAKRLPPAPVGDYHFAIDRTLDWNKLLELATTGHKVAPRPFCQLLVRDPEGNLAALPVRLRSFPKSSELPKESTPGHYLELILQEKYLELWRSDGQHAADAACASLAKSSPPTAEVFAQLRACAEETRRQSGDVGVGIIPGPRVRLEHLVAALDALRGKTTPQFSRIDLVLR